MSASFASPAQTPAQAYATLMEGNRRFVDDERSHPNQDVDRRAALTSGQAPFGVLFGCSDSRVAAETVFDRGLGDLFVVRTAGHVSGPEVLGSIEYGVGVLGTPLVVVLGHDSCGAVGAASKTCSEGEPPGGHIRDVVERVTPSVLAARAAGATETSQLVDEHVRRTADLLLERSPLIAAEVAAERCAVVGLSYSLAEGSLRFVSSHGPLTEGATT